MMLMMMLMIGNQVRMDGYKWMGMAEYPPGMWRITLRIASRI